MLAVVLFHLESRGPEGEEPLLACGWMGVDLFFVLSGFLITGILLDSEGKRDRLRNFYARRVLRITPLYYLVLALVFVVLPRFRANPELAYPPSDWPYYFLYVQNLLLPMIEIGAVFPQSLAHTWSLAVEEQFYLVWPWLVIALPRRVLVVLLVALLCAAPIARWSILSERPGDWHAYWLVYRNTLLHVDGLAVGCLLAFLVRWKPLLGDTRPSGIGPRGPTGLACLVIAIGALSFAVSIVARLAEAGVQRFPYQSSVPAAGTLMSSLLAIGFGGVLGATLFLRWRIFDLLLANAPMRFVGRISYGLYVYHYVVIDFAPRTHPAMLVAVTFAFATVSWFAFERPLLRLKAYFPTERAALPTEPSGAR